MMAFHNKTASDDVRDQNPKWMEAGINGRWSKQSVTRFFIKHLVSRQCNIFKEQDSYQNMSREQVVQKFIEHCESMILDGEVEFASVSDFLAFDGERFEQEWNKFDNQGHAMPNEADCADH